MQARWELEDWHPTYGKPGSITAMTSDSIVLSSEFCPTNFPLVLYSQHCLFFKFVTHKCVFKFITHKCVLKHVTIVYRVRSSSQQIVLNLPLLPSREVSRLASKDTTKQVKYTHTLYLNAQISFNEIKFRTELSFSDEWRFQFMKEFYNKEF